jgi:hypothetical protein
MSAESQKRQPLLEIGSANMPVDRQWLSSRHVIAATDAHAILKDVFSVLSVPRLCNENQLTLLDKSV